MSCTKSSIPLNLMNINHKNAKNRTGANSKGFSYDQPKTKDYCVRQKNNGDFVCNTMMGMYRYKPGVPYPNYRAVYNIGERDNFKCAECTQYREAEVVPHLTKDKDGNIRRSVIEVKPMRETLEPKATKGKSRKTLINESVTYVKNQAKWKAAREFCADRKLEFKIMTEKELGIR